MVIEEIEREGKQLPYLPEEIIEDNIVKRLPVKSLVRFACTCKRWRSLIFSDFNFNKAHIDHAKRPLWKIPEIRFYRDFLKRTIDCDCNIAPLPKETVTRYLHRPRMLGSCNGLLFVVGNIIISNGSKEVKEHALWNPYTNSIKRIDGPIVDYEFHYLMSGLSYDRVSGDYKAIVMLSDWGKCSWYVFSLRRNSWKKLSDLTINCNQDWGCPKPGITLDNGFCYWQIHLEYPRSNIICFDPVVEKFKDVPFPDKLSRSMGQLGALDGCLSLIHINSVWVMKEYGSWTELHVLRSSLQINMIQPVGYNSSKDQVVVIASDRYLTRYLRIADVKNGVVRKPSDIQLRLINDAFNVVPYTESLLCPWLDL